MKAPQLTDSRQVTVLTNTVADARPVSPILWNRVTSNTYVQTLEARISNLEQLIQHYEIKGASQTISSTSISLAISDSEPEDDTRPRPKLGTLLARAYPQAPDPDLSSPSEGADHSDDKSVTSMLACSMFLFAHQVFAEKGYEHDPLRFMQTRRMEFWDSSDRLAPILKPPVVKFEFPEMSLMLHLVDCYFDYLDLVLPLLHRPSFMRSIAEGFHELDRNFGATLLLVCAIGCRYTDHPGVVHELSTSTSCTAWSLYNQVNRMRKAPYLPHSLHEVQIYPLSALFLETYSPPETSWLIIGTGLRIMQDSGVHRKSFSKKYPLDRELWRRAFWVSVVLDRAFSTLLGRACVLQDEDFDADLPLICNDEDLDYPVPNPPKELNPPTRMCCFAAAIELNQILAFALRTIYSTRKSRIILGYVGKSWEKHMVATLDSALNKWVDTVPEQLRWDSKVSKKSRTELIQSAFLWTQFYETQLHIHRMFALKEPPYPELSTSSMIICKNASKQCVTIVDSARDVMMVPLHCFLLIKSVFMSTTFLLLTFWKEGGIDYCSPEYRAIEAGSAMVEQTAKRRRTSLHLQDIARALRATVDGSYTGWKFNLSDWARMKFEGVRYVDQDGTLTNERRTGRTKSGMDHASMCVASPPVTTGMMRAGQEPIAVQSIGLGSEGVTMSNRHPTQAMELFPTDFFTNPSLLFSGPSSTGFTGIGDQCIAGDSEATTRLFRNL
ncbi:hypothetical protein BDM02DRAFT_3188330 [Thelephora ganbajun]|uniref:Uncharacterized protein n=1 Tax=Thelephora ganbajun TaxID=370292 RepID=A0ACB6ZBG9_THEGA|nr:hypothetical protein BDM02DRAFT_3188330 [Thelephora ganbajun]